MALHEKSEFSKSDYTDIWITPQWIIDKLGIFDLDPCGHKPVIVRTANRIYTEKDDGLNRPWFGDVFVNPPYSDIGTWMSKFQIHRQGVALVFARTETSWFQQTARGYDAINFVARRVSFLRADGYPGTNGNAPSMLLAYGERNVERIKSIEGVLVTPVK